MSEIDQTEEVGFQTFLRQDGKVQLAFVRPDGSTLITCTLDAKQGAMVATALLNSAGGAARLLENIEQPKDGAVALDGAVQVQYWFVGDTKSEGTKAIVAQIGNTKLGFTVSEDQLWGLGRMLVRASWSARTTLSSTATLRRLIRDAYTDLRLWLLRAFANIGDGAKRLFSYFKSAVKFEFFIPLRNIEIGPGIATAPYPPVRGCIYCGAEVYSDEPHIRKHPFGDEHIVAEGLGGTLELPEASCLICERQTGATVEGDVLGKTMKALRVHLNLKKSGSGPHPKTLTLEATIFGKQSKINLPVEDYPIVFLMCSFLPPDPENNGDAPRFSSFHFVRVKNNEKELFQKYGIGAFTTVRLDNFMFCRMIAKIAHGLAVAELGADKFTPRLTKLIREGDASSHKFIGGARRHPHGSSPNALHRVAIGYQRVRGKTWAVARIRLFAEYDSPTYSVLVGESLEPPMARLKRFFSNRILRIPAR